MKNMPRTKTYKNIVDLMNRNQTQEKKNSFLNEKLGKVIKRERERIGRTSTRVGERVLQDQKEKRKKKKKWVGEKDINESWREITPT